MKDWNEQEIPIALSKGGVTVTTHPFDNLIRSGCSPWPPPEIVQKLYQSRQIRAFAEVDAKSCTSGLGFYCDLQSLHSEDAITWSVFGTATRAPRPVLTNWLADLMQLLDLPGADMDAPEVFLWRRIPHPDTLVPGGPEIDVGISSENAIILVEAKWQSGVGNGQGKMRDKDQIQLRGEFLQKYGKQVFPNRAVHAVVGIGLFADAFSDTTPDGITFRSTTWERVCDLASHPQAEELKRYLKWKTKLTKMAKRVAGGFSPPAPTPPRVRVRTGRFTEFTGP